MTCGEAATIDLAALRSYEAMGMRMGLQPAPGEGPGWRPLASLAAPDVAAAMVDASQERWGGPREAHGTWVVESLAWHLGMAAALPLMLGAAAPPLAPGRLRARVGPVGRVEGLACDPPPWDGGEDPVEAARAGLTAAIAPVVDAVAGLGIRTPAHLHRSAGDSVALAALWAGAAVGRRGDAIVLADRLLAPPVPFAVEVRANPDPSGPARRRAGCCLAYRVPEHDRCDDCPAGRLRRIAAARHRVLRGGAD
ncbi:MAG: (2Fe-2S)-binding protein [Thermoleophilia bacterium]